MIGVILYEVVSRGIGYDEGVNQFRLYIGDTAFMLGEADLKRLRRVILERFPISESETEEFDRKRALLEVGGRAG